MSPQSCALPVLITRPEAASIRFAEQLTGRFGARVLPIISPLLAPVFFDGPLPQGPFGSVILTSETGAQAAIAVRDKGARIPQAAFCVGDRTAEVAQQAGFHSISAAGDAEALISLLKTHATAGPFLHLRGRDARGDIAKRLNAAGIATQECVLYEQRPQALSPTARALISQSQTICVPIFSPRTAQILGKSLAQTAASAQLRLVLMSAAVASEATQIQALDRVIANQPTADAMLDAIAGLIFNA